MCGSSSVVVLCCLLRARTLHACEYLRCPWYSVSAGALVHASNCAGKSAQGERKNGEILRDIDKRVSARREEVRRLVPRMDARER